MIHRRGRRSPGVLAAILVALAATVFAGCGSGGEEATPRSNDADGATTAPTQSTSTTKVNDTVRLVRLDLVDTTRPTGRPDDAFRAEARALPTDVYLPRGAGAVPLVVLAHGLDGSPGKFTQLLRAWADAGFVAAAPRFPASSNVEAGGAGNPGLGDYPQQPADISFVIDRLLADPQVSPRIDAERIGVAGLSLGGGTVWALVGNPCCRDPRLRAAAIFDSMPFPFGPADEVNRIPVLIVHGDIDPVVPFAKARAAYDAAAAPKWLITLIGGIHAEPYEDTPSRHDEIVREATVAFWQETLLDDASAEARLEAAATAEGLARLEHR